MKIIKQTRFARVILKCGLINVYPGEMTIKV